MSPALAAAGMCLWAWLAWDSWRLRRKTQTLLASVMAGLYALTLLGVR